MDLKGKRRSSNVIDSRDTDVSRVGVKKALGTALKYAGATASGMVQNEISKVTGYPSNPSTKKMIKGVENFKPTKLKKSLHE